MGGREDRSNAEDIVWVRATNLGGLRPTPACFCAAAAAEGERQPLIHQHDEHDGAEDEQDPDNPSTPDKRSTVTQIILLYFMILIFAIVFILFFFFLKQGSHPGRQHLCELVTASVLLSS